MSDRKVGAERDEVDTAPQARLRLLAVVAIVSLLGTMLIGLWLVWPVSDRWSAGDDLPGVGPHAAPVVPPERLAPANAPIEPR